jgi:Sulfotransferase family
MSKRSPGHPQMLFVGGLHRSGTTLLAEMIAEHPLISGLTDTGVSHDEGQHLQDVIRSDEGFGGPGKFAFNPAAHLTEEDARAIPDAGTRMLASWLPFANADADYLVEKSPPNLLRFRFLQEAFPGARCIAVVRHPIAVSHATEFWARTSISDLIEHWLHAHEMFERDRSHLERILLLRYEDVVADPNTALARVDAFLGVSPHATSLSVASDTNRRYFARFRHARFLPARLKIEPHVLRFERRLRALGYGYSLRDRLS